MANTLTQGRTVQQKTRRVISVEGMANLGQYMCLSKTVALASEAPSSTEPVEKSYLNAVTDISRKPWNIRIKVNGKTV